MKDNLHPHDVDEDDDDDDDDDSPTETSMAKGTFDMLACEIPKKNMREACITHCLHRLGQEAALPEILPSYLFRTCVDGQISEHCQPDILQYAGQLLLTVFRLLDDGSVAVQATFCYVLEMFCERFEPAAVRPFLDNLVRKLAGMLEVTTERASCRNTRPRLSMLCYRKRLPSLRTMKRRPSVRPVKLSTACCLRRY